MMTNADTLHIEPTPMGWTAYYDPEGLTGHGRTKEEALVELLDKTDEHWRKALDERLSPTLTLALRGDVRRLMDELADERAIVDRVWKALGISSYEEAKGKAIDELVADLRCSLANSALDAKRFRVLMQWGLRHSTDSVVSDPANPYYVALRLEGRGSCTAHGATLAEVADRAIEWLEAPK